MESRKSRNESKKARSQFEEAKSVFRDFLARIFENEEPWFEEKRNGIVGHSAKNRLLIISYTEKENDTIRIIGARETTPREKRKHENENG